MRQAEQINQVNDTASLLLAAFFALAVGASILTLVVNTLSATEADAVLWVLAVALGGAVLGLGALYWFGSQLVAPSGATPAKHDTLQCAPRSRSALRCPLCFDLLRARGTWSCGTCSAQAHDVCVAELGPCHEQVPAPSAPLTASPAPRRASGWGHLEQALAAPSQVYTPVGPQRARPSTRQPADICAFEPANEPTVESGREALQVTPSDLARDPAPAPRQGSWRQLERALRGG